MLNLRFIRRQLTATKQQSAIFVVCVALSMVSLVALRGLGDSINRALLTDARELQASDIIVESNFGLSEPVQARIDALVAAGEAQAARLWEFYTVARLPDREETLLVNIKAVEPGYPFYGQVELASGRAFADVLAPGDVIVEQALLDRLGVAVGDQLRLGEATLTIADVVTHEPDRPVNFFALGPRVFVNAADLAALDLVRAGSRVSYTTLLKVADAGQLDAIAASLSAVRDVGQEDVETYLTAPSGVQRFFENLLFFLSLVAIFTLLLAGIGIQSALTAFLRERYTTIAIVKTLGATRRFVTLHFYAIVGILGLLGMALGVALGLLLQLAMPLLLGDLIPPDVTLALSPRAVLEGLLLGAFVVAAFTFIPLARLGELKPHFIFRKEEIGLHRRWPYLVALLLILAAFAAMVLWLLDDWRTSLYFTGAVLGLLAIAAALAEVTLRLLRGRRPRSLPLRQALRGLFRPRNPTRAIIITLSASLAVLFCIYLVERTLDASFVAAYPEDAPNVFFLDIQPDQVDDFAAALGEKTEFFPVVRGTVAAVNGEPPRRVDEDEQTRGGPDGPDGGRDFQFNLTYRDALLDDERIAQGGSLFDPTYAGAQVSILDDVQDFTHVNLGDTVTFRIQGVPLEAKVTSVRTRTEESVQPFFSFVFPSAVLADAPQTIFTALREDEAAIPALQNRMVARFPNVSVIDVTAAIATFADLARRVTRIIRFFTAFSILAGLLIVVSAVFATRFARIQEAAYYKVLGAKSRFVLRVFTAENLLLGLVSALLGLGMAQLGSWLINTRLFDLDFRPFWGASLLMVGITMLLVTLVGMAASVSILRSKPIMFLREQTGEE
ncbi:MAG: FtsX-like permease family protein [Caldilineaceae bacterium]